MNICVVTGTRAEYGLLKQLISLIQEESGWTLQILATGAHLSPEFGLTWQQIVQDGFAINKKVEMLLSADTATSIVKSMGVGMIGYADALAELKPDLLIVLGDRYEMLAVATSALILKIPIVHIHGGEITEGAYDDAIRHAITKLSHVHFASTEAYRKRIIQLGEDPLTVHNVGAIGIDNIRRLTLWSRAELEQDLNIKFKKFNYQVTFHPATLDNETPESQFRTLLHAISRQQDSFFVFTKSNADTDGRVINRMIDEYVHLHPDHSAVFTSLGTLRFLSVVNVCDAVIGNSSSGIVEAPSLHTATINIGDRQKGRIQAASIINVEVQEDQISKAIQMTQSAEFQTLVKAVENPYGEGSVSEKIMDVLRKINPSQLGAKKFHDL